MTDNLSQLSESELAAVIENAKKALKDKQEGKRKEVIAQIRELAASINVGVEIIEGGKPASRKGGRVPVKYRNPANPADKWTGRGMKPKWLRELIDQGRNLEEFEV
ncbi:H-NS family nucleoid-associated regulatory protein [Methylococcus sp. EFPC2]|uniref:H-NS histone family protein n=1 Tax=Methylococcus sp. EFPC2 TaxID=2812648 RepID=UPI0019674AB8|nr:H-NS histone family protein [Methylococcus sp. EFPC2]QSA98230.1 H-NS histone family protein [Methylococcus sp. EFPC2]